ncbi:MAG: fumarate hydratase C-terminal domain-containing protein [Promethearchaeota archaeon]|jgi:fumarate hydratase subunit beta
MNNNGKKNRNSHLRRYHQQTQSRRRHRDSWLPVLKKKIEESIVDELTSKLKGSVIMHAGFSVAGFGPTTSGKEAIQGSMHALASAGVKIHLGKGSLKKETIDSLNQFNSVFAVTPPVTALLMKKLKSVRVIAFEHEGMEAMHEIEVEGLPAIIAIAHGESIYSPESK